MAGGAEVSEKVIIEFKYSRPVTQVVNMKVEAKPEGLNEWCIENNEDPHDVSTWIDKYLDSLDIDVEDGTAVFECVTLTMPGTDRYSNQRPWVVRDGGQGKFYISYDFEGDELAPHRRITDVFHSHDDLADAAKSGTEVAEEREGLIHDE